MPNDDAAFPCLCRKWQEQRHSRCAVTSVSTPIQRPSGHHIVHVENRTTDRHARKPWLQQHDHVWHPYEEDGCVPSRGIGRVLAHSARPRGHDHK